MTGVFISYRRDDQPGFTGRLADALESAFGADKVFRDIDDIRPGEDFVVVLQQHLHSVDAILVMIGPDWLSASQNGVRRLDDAGDFVRMEIQAGLESGKPVIPVLLAGATMPLAADLPAALSSLARRQAVLLSDANWRGDVERLIASLRVLLADKAGQPIGPHAGWPWPVRCWLWSVLLLPGSSCQWITKSLRRPPPASQPWLSPDAGRHG